MFKKPVMEEPHESGDGRRSRQLAMLEQGEKHWDIKEQQEDPPTTETLTVRQPSSYDPTFPMQVVLVRFLLRELRSHMPRGMAKKQINRIAWKELKTEKTNTTVSFVCEGITRTSTPSPKASFSFRKTRIE